MKKFIYLDKRMAMTKAQILSVSFVKIEVIRKLLGSNIRLS